MKMELNFVESLRRRWTVLGIDVKGKGKEVAPTKSKRRNAQGSEDESGLEDENIVEADAMEVDAREEIEEDEAARKQIMDGAIVKAVISNAAQGALLLRRLAALRMS